ncbi:MAG: GNAT family N-acetyltransferase [Bacillota bacterium]|nr:GNAT family N-acetyltransferase [Bacillota bacterium]
MPILLRPILLHPWEACPVDTQPVEAQPVDARPPDTGDLAAFMAVFVRYYAEEFAIDLPPSEISYIRSEVEKGIREGYLHLLLATDREDGSIRGFILYQIDTPASDWCLRPGSGFIRELYVMPAERRHGLGSRLVAAAEHELRQRAAAAIYLTTDQAAAFWCARGYRDSGLICRRNDGRIFEKDLPAPDGPRP